MIKLEIYINLPKFTVYGTFHKKDRIRIWMIVRDPDRTGLKSPEPNWLDSHRTAWGVHHGVLLVVLNQLRQAVEHLATVHVEFFVYVPEQKKRIYLFPVYSCDIFPHFAFSQWKIFFLWPNNWIYKSNGFCENYFFVLFFAHYFLVHWHHFSKIKSHTEVTKQVGSMFFLLFLLDDRRIQIRISD